jgi:phosphate transport system substrate-binding protein
MTRKSVVRVLAIVAVGAALCVAAYFSPAYFMPKEEQPAPAAHLATGGTSVVAILLENRWRSAYLKERGVVVDYESTGSTSGIQQMMEGKDLIAFTHAPLTDEQRKTAQDKGGPVIQIPVLLCAVVPIYQVKELKDQPPLKFSGEVLADIFLGKITHWNDPALQKLNEGVALPSKPIVVVHRQDSSGTTYLFTNYLYQVSEAWRKQVGAPGNEIKWPVGEGQSRNQGVKGHVFATEGAIGYVDLIHVSSGDVQYGAVQNKDRTAVIHAAAANLTAAVKSQLAEIKADLKFDLTNKPGKDSYPIGGVIWAVCYQEQQSSTLGRVVNFLQWATHDGQRFATNMAFAPLPEELVGQVEQKLREIKIVTR